MIKLQYNLIAVFRSDQSKVLMCRRKKNPYKGLLNFVGGKIEPDEDHADAAYRELWEETSIRKSDIRLTHVMDLSYALEGGSMEVYAGILNADVTVGGTENTLCWIDVDSDFSDVGRFAGEGNIYHMMRYFKAYREQIFGGGTIELS